MASLLLYEHNTAFNHTLWSRYDMLQLWQFSPELLREHNRQQRMYGYSPIQDAFYALVGEYPNQSKAGKLWGAVMQTPEFEEACELFTNAPSLHVKTNLVYWLGLVFEYFIKPPHQEGQQPKPQPGTLFAPPPPPKGNKPPQPKAAPDGGKPTAYDLDADTLADMMTGGKGEEEKPGDTESNPLAGPGNGFDLEIPAGFKMPSLDSVKEKNATDEIIGSFAGNEPGTPTEKRRIVEEFHRARGTRNFARFLGFAETVVSAATREVHGAHGHRKGYTRGRFDGRVTASEKAKLASGDLMALSRFADGKLRKVITNSQRPMGNGDVYFLRDESSSMRGNSARDMAKEVDYDLNAMSDSERADWLAFLRLPDKDTQALNLEIALAYWFKKTGRKLTSVAWDSANTRVYEYGTPGLETHLNTFLNGGTRLGHVLTKVFDLMRENHSTDDDILICTDGEIGDYPEHDAYLMTRINEFKARGGKIWAVLVDGMKSSKLGFADGILTIDSLTNAQKNLGEVVRKMTVNRVHKGSKEIH